jgi:subtilase family serine protease
LTYPRNRLIISSDFPDRSLGPLCAFVSALRRYASLSLEENLIWRVGRAAVIVGLATTCYFGASAKAAGPRASARDLVTHEIDDRLRVTLRGNTRPEAKRENDRGPVPDDFKLEHMLLQLRRPPELEQQYDEYLETLTQRNSANFHQWLTPSEVGDAYGLSHSDLRRIESWLRSHRIRVNFIYPNRVVMDISATAAELREAFGVNVHFLEVNGQRHYANVNDPEIPEALASAIVGIVSIHDFRPHPMIKPRAQYTYTDSNGTFQTVTPADLAEIYNLNPLFSQGITGANQTVVVVEDSDPFATTDWTTFEQEFKLTQYGGTLTVTHPNAAGNNCIDPGDNSNDIEVELDMEYAAAAAPAAAIVVATCADTATPGPIIALENIAASDPHPYIISVSYGECEPGNGAANNAALYSAYQTAASEGISVFVSSGDEGPTSCDADEGSASHGINVSGWASTPYNVAVGGTDFGDTFAGTNATYWSATNSSALESAMSYIPEIPWNDSCAGVLVATYVGDNPPYGSSGFCNSAEGKNFRTTASGSGGPSGCATGAASTSGEVSGTCVGYPKPSWQSGLFGNPDDAVRDIPDVSLFASNGLWGHLYVFCYSHAGSGFIGNPCTGTPDPTARTGTTWSAAGGTSFASPILAGIQALVNQRTAALTITPIPGQGNPNPVYYAIAAAEYGSSGSTLCNSSAQPLPRRGVATSCVFYDVTQGDIDVNCTFGSANCYDPGATFGNGFNGAIITGTVSGLTVSAAGVGYTSDPACTISAPHNRDAYNGYSGGTQATCTATASGGHVTAVTLTNAGAGYAPNPVCTLTGGGGTGATCSVSGVTDAAYQPAFAATPGWDFATGIGTINAYNLVFSPLWAEGP